ncbi:uncharacterized protein LOC127709041 [Mytilus californianus]|uniref:uncharacterized protein LOC127709041 n=1 Tax=Mytilus californianus TaxID=6549 RepID=UPI0022477192|nr:uncharacterized protein LOC127709041 [Mytilus californianus]
MNSTLQLFKPIFYEQVDPIVITQKLSKLRRLSDCQKTFIFSLFRRSVSRQHVWDYLLPIIEETCSLNYVLEILLECGYIELFINIALQCKLSSPEELCIQRTKVLMSSRRSSQNLLMQLKILTHNIQFDNPRKCLKEKTKLYKSAFLSEKNYTKKIVKADHYAASLCAEIDSYGILYVRQFPTHGLFEELKNIIPHTSNTHVTQVAHDTRLALAYAQADEEGISEDNLRNAMAASIYIGYCVELVEMLYIYIFNLIEVYEKCPIEGLVDKILNIAEYCAGCLQEETDELIISFWKRRIYSRVAFCLLGLSNRGDIIPGRRVSSKNVRKAKDLMVELDKLWDGFEIRRLMFYYVGKARIAEIEDDLDLAIEYISLAIDIGIRGDFGEVTYIKNYSNSLTGKFSLFQKPLNDYEIHFKYSRNRTPVENEDDASTMNDDLENDSFPKNDIMYCEGTFVKSSYETDEKCQKRTESFHAEKQRQSLCQFKVNDTYVKQVMWTKM